jgi:hypothetical protein
MLTALTHHIRRNVIAYTALFVALGGTSYAAFNLPANSVGARQLRRHAVSAAKLDPRTVAAPVSYWAVIGPGGQVLRSRPRGARVSGWDSTLAIGLLKWPTLGSNCLPLASGSAGFVRAWMRPQGTRRGAVLFQTFNAAGQFDSSEQATIAVLCPQP